MDLKRIGRYIIDLLQWCIGLAIWLASIFTITFLATFSIFLFFSFSDRTFYPFNNSKMDLIRLIGLFLQLIGSSILIFSLKDRLKILKGVRFREIISYPFLKFPIFRKKSTNTIDFPTEEIKLSEGASNLKKSPNENSTFKEVIEFFNNEISEIRSDIKSNYYEVNDRYNKLLKDQHNAENKLDEKLIKTEKLIIETNISNPTLELISISFILIGLVLGTVSDLVYNYLVFFINAFF